MEISGHYLLNELNTKGNLMGNKYEIFISFKHLDESGIPTYDSNIANKIYQFLTDKGLKVFFAEVTLKELGVDSWKKKINAALDDSKVFIAVGTANDRMMSEWVLRERVKFLTLREKDSLRAIYSYISSPMTIEELPHDLHGYECFQDSKEDSLGRLYTYICNHMQPPTVIYKDNFVIDVYKNLNQKGIVVIFSQDFTKIDDYYQDLKQDLSNKFSKRFYIINVPSFTEDKEKYFKSIASCCNICEGVKELQDWKNLMYNRLSLDSKEMLLMITDLEEGNEELDRQFAATVRNLRREFSHFYALFIGRSRLAKMVYGEGDLSPLNTAKTMFFPDSNLKIDEEQITLQFAILGCKYEQEICFLLEKDTLGMYTPYSYNEVINQLFWKNLLKKENNKFVWKDEITKRIAKNVLKC